jgi:hypothetical protein
MLTQAQPGDLKAPRFSKGPDVTARLHPLPLAVLLPRSGSLDGRVQVGAVDQRLFQQVGTR